MDETWLYHYDPECHKQNKHRVVLTLQNVSLYRIQTGIFFFAPNPKFIIN